MVQKYNCDYNYSLFFHHKLMGEDLVHSNLSIHSFDNIHLIRKTSDDAIDDLINESFDFIYIDGIHTYDQVNKDIDNYKPLIVKGGFIGGHDYHPVWGGVVQSINEKVGEPNKTFQDTSWVVKID